MKRKYIGLLAIVGLAAFLFGPSPAFAQINLGTAQNFAVLAGTTVTNTGAGTNITGDVGVHPGSAITGLLASQVVGTIHSADAVALQAKSDLTAAYLVAENPITTPCPAANNLTGLDLGPVGGRTLTPGVYCFDAAAFLTGTLTLDFLGDPNAVFVIKTVSTLITAVGSSVVLVNNAGNVCAPNVFWKVGSSATIEVGSTFVGNILALTDISVKTNAGLTGRALARNGQVSLDTNIVSIAACGIIPPGCPTITVSPATLPNGNIGTLYSQQITASGGTAPYTFAVSSGTLPPGLSLSAGGTLSGIPTTLGTFNFQITATDEGGCPGIRDYSIVMAAAIPPGTGGVSGGPTLDSFGLAILLALLAVAGVFAVNRFTS